MCENDYFDKFFLYFVHAGPHLFPFESIFYFITGPLAMEGTNSSENFLAIRNSLFCIVEACQTTRHLRSPSSFLPNPSCCFFFAPWKFVSWRRRGGASQRRKKSRVRSVGVPGGWGSLFALLFLIESRSWKFLFFWGPHNFLWGRQKNKFILA